MTDLTQMVQNGGGANVWLYLPVAVLLGALHGLEPGHSKTMMAAFIIAVRGTVWQAVLLGVSAALSHSLIIWVLAALALYYGNNWAPETIEPYLQMTSGVLILLLAAWMFFRTRLEVNEARLHQLAHAASIQTETTPPRSSALSIGSAPPSESEDNPWASASHSHGTPSSNSLLPSGQQFSAGGIILPGIGIPVAERRVTILMEPIVGINLKKRAPAAVMLDTGHGWLNVTISEVESGARFRIYPCKADGQPVPMPKSTQLKIETARLDGITQAFRLESKERYWESTNEVASPHEFLAIVTLGHSDHAHTYRIRFTAPVDNATAPTAVEEIDEDGIEYQDAHERSHAEDIAKRFSNRAVTTPQIILFGITGGLMPCPAAFTILLVCLQLKRAPLGFGIVGAFSFGLALTMVTVGAVAAWSVGHAQKRFSGFGEWMRRAPYISCAMLVLLASYMAWSGWQGLHHHAPH